jgi:hypothetical protein
LVPNHEESKNNEDDDKEARTWRVPQKITKNHILANFISEGGRENGGGNITKIIYKQIILTCLTRWVVCVRGITMKKI